jgi:hypothetical protein
MSGYFVAGDRTLFYADLGEAMQDALFRSSEAQIWPHPLLYVEYMDEEGRIRHVGRVTAS